MDNKSQKNYLRTDITMENPEESGISNIANAPPMILDWDLVKKEWEEETKGMSDIEKVRYMFKKLDESENQE